MGTTRPAERRPRRVVISGQRAGEGCHGHRSRQALRDHRRRHRRRHLPGRPTPAAEGGAMAYEVLSPANLRTLVAAVDLSGSQYRALVKDGSGRAGPPAAGGLIYGVLQNRPGAGEPATVAITGISKGEVAAAVAQGAILM